MEQQRAEAAGKTKSLEFLPRCSLKTALGVGGRNREAEGPGTEQKLADENRGGEVALFQGFCEWVGMEHSFLYIPE